MLAAIKPLTLSVRTPYRNYLPGDYSTKTSALELVYNPVLPPAAHSPNYQVTTSPCNAILILYGKSPRSVSPTHPSHLIRPSPYSPVVRAGAPHTHIKPRPYTASTPTSGYRAYRHICTCMFHRFIVSGLHAISWSGSRSP